MSALIEAIVPHVATCTTPDCETCDGPEGLSYLRPACSSPRSAVGDGRGREAETCPRHGGGES